MAAVTSWTRRIAASGSEVMLKNLGVSYLHHHQRVEEVGMVGVGGDLGVGERMDERILQVNEDWMIAVG